MPQQRGDDGRVSDKEARKDEGRRRKKNALFFSLFSALHIQSLSLNSFVSEFRTGKHHQNYILINLEHLGSRLFVCHSKLW